MLYYLLLEVIFMKVYNTKHLNNKQRFSLAILAGIISALLCGFLYAVIEMMLPWHIPLLYVAMAYGVSYAVKIYGRGVQPKFTAVGIICVILSIIAGYLFSYMFAFGFHALFIPTYLAVLLSSIFSFDLRGIIEIICIAYAIYIAYYNSRVL